MNPANNNYAQYYQGEGSNKLKYSSTSSGYRAKSEKPGNYQETNFGAMRAGVSKEQYEMVNQLARNQTKKSIAQEYLMKENASKFQISSDSDEEDSLQEDKRSYSYKPSSPVLSIQGHQQLAQHGHHQSKNEQIYQLKMKIMSLENEYLVDKKQLIDKYEKQLFDLNKQKVTLQQDKIKLLKQIESLNKKISSLKDENQQLKEQLQVFVGENRKTPNFNSKDFGEVDLIVMNAHKDDRIKQLENKISTISKEKQKMQSTLQKNKIDRSSGQSFGGKNFISVSFGQIEENLRISLQQSSKINENLTKEVEQLSKKLEKEEQRVTQLTLQNLSLQADKQAKSKEIIGLNEKLIKSEGKVYILQKQLQNYNKKIKINQDLLEIKDKEVRKLNETVENQDEKIRKLIRQFEKSQKEWATKNSRLEVEKTLTLNEKVETMKKEETKMLNKIQSLVEENKKLKENLESTIQREERLKTEITRTQKQKQDLNKRLQENSRHLAKLKNTCTVQQDRIIQLQKSISSVKLQRKNLKEEAEKIMKKQKSEIHTLKQSLEFALEKNRKVESETKLHETEMIAEMRGQNQELSLKIQELRGKNVQMGQINQSLRKELNAYEQSIIELKRQNYELQKQIEQLKADFLATRQQQSPSKQKEKEKQKDKGTPQMQRAYNQLKSEYSQLQTKFDKQTTEKEEMVQALNEKIRFLESRFQEDSSRYQEVADEKNYYMKQAESLTYKCQQMYEYIQKMHSEGESPEGNGQNLEKLQQLNKQNEFLKKQVYRLSSELQALQGQFKGQIMKKESLKSMGSPPKQAKNLGSPKNHDHSSSLESSLHETNPLQSALEIMKIEKEQMMQTINYQNEMIQSLQRDLYQAVKNIEQLKANVQTDEYVKNQEMLNVIHQKNTEMLEEKVKKINEIIIERETVIREITQRNKEIERNFKQFQEEQSQSFSKMILEMNILKEQKKELHEELDQANTQLIILEKERSKDRAELMNQLKSELEHRLLFINEDIEKFKQEIKRLKKQQVQNQQKHKLEIECRQELYAKERSKLMNEIEILNKQLSNSNQKIKKANQMIAQEKTLQSEISQRNQKIQVEYFEMKNHFSSLVSEIQQLSEKNHRLSIYIQEMEQKHDRTTHEMHTEIESLIRQNQESYHQIENFKRQIDGLETQKISLLLKIQQKQNQLQHNLNDSRHDDRSKKQQPTLLPQKDYIQTLPSTVPNIDQKPYPNQNQNQSEFVMIQKKGSLKSLQENSQQIPPVKRPILDLYGNGTSPKVLFEPTNDHINSTMYPTQDITFSRPKNVYSFVPDTVKYQKTYFEPYQNRKLLMKDQKVQFYRI